MIAYSLKSWIGLVVPAMALSLAIGSLEAQQLGGAVSSPSNLGSFSTSASGGALNSVKIRNTGPSIGSLGQPARSSLGNPLSSRIGAGNSNPLGVNLYQRRGATTSQLGGRLGQAPSSPYPGLGGGYTSFSPRSQQLAAPLQLPTSNYRAPSYTRQPSLNLGLPGQGGGAAPTFVMPKTGTALQNQFGMTTPTRKPVAEDAAVTTPAVAEPLQKRSRAPAPPPVPTANLKPIGASLSSVSGPRAGRFLQKGEHLFAEGEYILASNAFRTAANMERKNAVTHLVRVHALVATAQYRQAELALEKSQSLDPRLSLVKHVKLQELYGDSADLVAHLSSLKRYYVANNAEPDAVKLYGYILLISDRVSEARKVLNSGSAANPEDAMLAALLSIAKQ